MSAYSPAIVYGFHVCDSHVASDFLSGSHQPRASTNDYDWLGEGFYCFESDPERAQLFGEAIRSKPSLSKGVITDPLVLGVVIELGNCLDLTTVNGRRLLQLAESTLNKLTPKNVQARRHRDCAAIDALHQITKRAGNLPFQSVRAAFQEGDPLFESAVLHTEDHIQIAIIDPCCIKGFFLPRLS